MVSEDKMQEEIDKATAALGMQKELDLYSTLLRIKYAKDREEVMNSCLLYTSPSPRDCS